MHSLTDDPFRHRWWNYVMVQAWVCSRDAQFVRQVAAIDLREVLPDDRVDSDSPLSLILNRRRPPFSNTVHFVMSLSEGTEEIQWELKGGRLLARGTELWGTHPSITGSAFWSDA